MKQKYLINNKIKFISYKKMNSSIRTASHSGSWYDKNPIKLSKELNQYLSSSNKYEEYQSLKSIIVPHSGLRYGGPVAAKAFINVNPDNYNRVVILGPSHYEYFKGCGLHLLKNLKLLLVMLM